METKKLKDVFESLENITEPNLQLVVPSYYMYLRIQKLAPYPYESAES